MDCRSRERNSGLMWAAKPTACPGPGSAAAGCSGLAAPARPAGAGGPAGPQSQRGTGSSAGAAPAAAAARRGLAADRRGPLASPSPGTRPARRGTRGRRAARPRRRRAWPSATQRARCSSVNSRPACARRRPGRAADALAVPRGAAEDLGEPHRHALRVTGRHVREQRARAAASAGTCFSYSSRVIRVSAGSPPAHWNSVGSSGGHRVAEPDVPVHAAAERLVAASGRTGTAHSARARPRRPGRRRPPAALGQRDRAGDPVRAVLGHLDGGLALVPSQST